MVFSGRRNLSLLLLVGVVATLVVCGGSMAHAMQQQNMPLAIADHTCTPHGGIAACAMRLFSYATPYGPLGTLLLVIGIALLAVYILGKKGRGVEELRRPLRIRTEWGIPLSLFTELFSRGILHPRIYA